MWIRLYKFPFCNKPGLNHFLKQGTLYISWWFSKNWHIKCILPIIPILTRKIQFHFNNNSERFKIYLKKKWKSWKWSNLLIHSPISASIQAARSGKHESPARLIKIIRGDSKRSQTFPFSKQLLFPGVSRKRTADPKRVQQRFPCEWNEIHILFISTAVLWWWEINIMNAIFSTSKRNSQKIKLVFAESKRMRNSVYKALLYGFCLFHRNLQLLPTWPVSCRKWTVAGLQISKPLEGWMLGHGAKDIRKKNFSSAIKDDATRSNTITWTDTPLGPVAAPLPFQNIHK